MAQPILSDASDATEARPAVKVSSTRVTVRGKEYQRFVVRYPDEATGKRQRKTFSTLGQARRFAAECERDAKAAAERQTILQRRVGEDDAGKLNAANLRDAITALAKLAGRGTLSDAADVFVREYEAQQRDVPTVSELVARYVQASQDQGLRERSVSDLRHRLARFGEVFGSRKVNAVSPAEAKAWLEGLRTRQGKPLAALSRQHFRFATSGLFNYAIEMCMASANPMASATRSRRARGSNRLASTAEILTPAEAEALLEAAAGHAPEMVAPLAIALFAGVRTAELTRMTWERHVSLDKAMVHITSDIAKKRSVRNIKITPTLAAWLAGVPVRAGFVAPQGKAWRTALELVRDKAKLSRWPHNCMRHSFASYHLEAYQDPQATSLILGHRGGDNLLFEHYRTLTTAEDAAAFFAIAPRNQRGVTPT